MGHHFLSHFRMEKEPLAGTASATPSKESGWGNVEGSSIPGIVVSGGSAMGGSTGRGPALPTRLDHTEVNILEGKRRR